MIIILILLREIVEVWRANVHYVDCRVYPLTHCSNIKAKEVSSQMLLLCAWRSVKELSLFLGDLCSRDSSATGYNWNLLSTDLEVSRALVIVIYFPAYYTFWWIRYEVFKLIVLIFYHSFNLHINNPRTVLFKDFCKVNSKDISLSLDFLLIDLDSWFRFWFT